MKITLNLLLRSLAIVVLLAGLIHFDARAAEVVIDSLDAGSTHEVFLTWPGPPTTGTSNAASTAAIGGDRDLSLTILGGTDENTSIIRTNTSTVVLSLSQGPNMQSIARVQWDGPANTDATLDCTTGFTPTDLTGGGTNDGIVVRTRFSDSTAAILRLRLYTDCGNWRVASLNAPIVNTGDVVDMFFPFTSFGGGAGTLNTTSIRAIELEMDSSLLASAGADIEIVFLKATTMREYGDLPSSFTGYDAYHIPQGMRFGGSLDAEPSASNAGATARGDDSDNPIDDEDGIYLDFQQKWVPGNFVDIYITVAGCSVSTVCRVSAWMDWNGDGNFSATERIINQWPYTASGTNIYPIEVDTFALGYTTGSPLYARFRVCPTLNACNTPTLTAVTNGEIEDYLFYFTPSAVELVRMSASGRSITLPNMAMAGMAVLALVSGTMALGWRLRRK